MILTPMLSLILLMQLSISNPPFKVQSVRVVSINLYSPCVLETQINFIFFVFFG